MYSLYKKYIKLLFSSGFIVTKNKQVALCLFYHYRGKKCDITLNQNTKGTYLLRVYQ